MTDINHKPKCWNEPLNQMTEDEWKEYFRLRDALDTEMSQSDIDCILECVENLIKKKATTDAMHLMGKIPLEPHYALGMKYGLGLRSVMYNNLSKAKEVFPDEF